MLERLIAEFRKSIRPLVTLMFAGGIVYGFLTKLIPGEAFLVIASVVIKYWFDERAKMPPNGGAQ